MPPSTVSILCVDPNKADQSTLEEILKSSPWSVCPDCSWMLQICDTLSSAWRALLANRFAMVLCDHDLKAGTWRELMDLLARLHDPPFLIVTSRAADERLWAEALNLGAYDVLAKPFDRTEVMRVLSMAWINWLNRNEVAHASCLVRKWGGPPGPRPAPRPA